jgi:hypothetical protein
MNIMFNTISGPEYNEEVNQYQIIPSDDADDGNACTQAKG